jgi:DNA-binding PadR family transcriptional regulator
MLKWSIKLLGLFLIFSSFICHAQATQYDDDGFPRIGSFNLEGLESASSLRGSFNFGSFFLGETGGGGLGQILDPENPPYAFDFQPQEDDPSKPSNTNARNQQPVEEGDEAAVDPASLIQPELVSSPAEAADLTAVIKASIEEIIRRSRTNLSLFGVLNILKKRGPCYYAVLQQELPFKSKLIYQQCAKYRTQGLIQDSLRKGAGIFEITPCGLYALSILSKTFSIEDLANYKAQTKAREDEFEEEDEEENQHAEEEACEEESFHFSSDSGQEKATINSFIGNNFARKSLLSKVLQLLQAQGLSSFEFIQRTLASEQVRFNHIWKECLQSGLIVATVLGQYGLSEDGVIALQQLSEQGYASPSYGSSAKPLEIVSGDDADHEEEENEAEEINPEPGKSAVISRPGRGYTWSYSNLNYKQKADICQLLELLQTNGECGYNTLLNKKVYSVCNLCVQQGLVLRRNNGYYSITQQGLSALEDLHRQGFTSNPYQTSKKRVEREQDVHEQVIPNDGVDECEDEAPPKKKAAPKKSARKQLPAKKKARKSSDNWIDEIPQAEKEKEAHEDMIPGYDMDEYEDEAPSKKKPARKQPAKKHLPAKAKVKKTSSIWPEEFNGFRKKEMHLAILKVLADGNPYRAYEITERAKKYCSTVINQRTNNLRLHVTRGWLRFKGDPRLYSITREGLRVLEKTENKTQEEIVNELITVRHESPHEEDQDSPQSAQIAEPARSLRRTRSMNDLEAEDHKTPLRLQPLERIPEHTKRQKQAEAQPVVVEPVVVVVPEVEEQPQVEIVAHQPAGAPVAVAEVAAPMDMGADEEDSPDRIRWEDLADKMRTHLLEQLDQKILASVLANEQLMKDLLKGDFIKNLCNVVAMQFSYQFGISIDHVLEEYLRDKIKVTVAEK